MRPLRIAYPPLGSSLAALLVAVLAATAVRAGKAGRIVGDVVGADAAGATRGLTGVAVIDASTGNVQAAGRVTKKDAFRFAVPPGVYHVAVSSDTQSGALGALSPLLAVGAARKTRTQITLLGAASRTPSVVVASSRTAGGDTVATMGDVTVQSPGFPPASIAGPLFTPLFNETQDRCRLRWVDTSRQFLEQRERELELQRQGRLDPSTPIRDELITPTLRVEGDFTNDLENTTGELRVVDIGTGTVVLRRSFSGPTRDLEELLRRWGRSFARAMCPEVTATTTTIEPISTSTTTPVPTTTSTVPGAACTSSGQCGPEECCSPTLGRCCTVGAVNTGTPCTSDSIGNTFYGCCYNVVPNDPPDISPDTCGGQAPPKCPARCEIEQFYNCAICQDDGKFVSHYGF